jgi:hypothetical protein
MPNKKKISTSDCTGCTFCGRLLLPGEKCNDLCYKMREFKKQCDATFNAFHNMSKLGEQERLKDAFYSEISGFK